MNRQQSQKAFSGTFDALDLDGNGSIDIDELQLGFSKQGNMATPLTVSALEDLIKMFDTNNDGVLQRDEFVKLMESTELEEFFAHEDDIASKERGRGLDLEAVMNLSPTPEETSTLVKEKLAKFDEVLDNIDTKKKIECMMAQEKCPDLCGDDFKLAFLRCEVFKVKPAVNRWIKYWEVRVSILGEVKAFLPMTLEGAMEGQGKAVSCSYMAVAAGATDPDGRAIVLMDVQQEKSDLSDDELFMAVWYHCHVCLSTESAQKRGVVIYLRAQESVFGGRQSLWKRLIIFEGVFPIRMSAIHIVNPPAFIKVLVRIAKIMMSKKLRSRMNVHPGSMDEALKSLSKFGLARDTCPEVFGGDLSFSPGAKLMLHC